MFQDAETFCIHHADNGFLTVTIQIQNCEVSMAKKVKQFTSKMERAHQIIELTSDIQTARYSKVQPYEPAPYKNPKSHVQCGRHELVTFLED